MPYSLYRASCWLIAATSRSLYMSDLVGTKPVRALSFITGRSTLRVAFAVRRMIADR